jgi:hypothetical protein
MKNVKEELVGPSIYCRSSLDTGIDPSSQITDPETIKDYKTQCH